MSYTKGKLLVDRYTIHCIRDGVDTRIAHIGIMPIKFKDRKSLNENEMVRVDKENEANAERLVLCWNSHDKLLAACKDLMDANEYARKVSLREESPRGMVWGEVRSRLDAAKLNAKAAITEAEKE